MPQIAILTDLTLSTLPPGQVYETAYGLSTPITRQDNLLVCAPGLADPRATIQALKTLGATHLWLCESVGALSPLLEPGDWLVPEDFIDGTRGQFYTYFTEKAGGYVQQVPPFDPASREALLAGAHIVTPRPFRRGVYVCVSNTRLETPAEALFWTRAGAQVVGRFLSPGLVLARELELAVAALVQVVRPGGAAGQAAGWETYLPALARAAEGMGG